MKTNTSQRLIGTLPIGTLFIYKYKENGIPDHNYSNVVRVVEHGVPGITNQTCTLLEEVESGEEVKLMSNLEVEVTLLTEKEAYAIQIENSIDLVED